MKRIFANLTKTHIIFIITGTVLSVVCMLLSQIECMTHVEFGFAGLIRSSDCNFFGKTFLFFGTIEILLLLGRNLFSRVFAVLVSAVKTVLPWLFFHFLDAVTAIINDWSAEYVISNAIPYIVTALSVLSLIQMVAMVFVIPKKKAQRSTDVPPMYTYGETEKLSFDDNPTVRLR